MKGIIGSVTLMFFLVGCGNGGEKVVETTDFSHAARLLTQVKTTQFFTDEKIGEDDIKKILDAGINAPSAMNTQPWYFTAVTDEETNLQLKNSMAKMRPPKGPDLPPKGLDENSSKGKAEFSKAPNKAGMGDAPLTIVISCKEGSDFSAALAVQNMSVEAQLLGYGTKIMTAPTMALNTEEYKTLLNVPEGYNVVGVLLVGQASAEEVHALSGATTRRDFSDLVTIID